MKPTEFEQTVFRRNAKRITEMQHYDDCPYKGRSIPITECACSCYEMQIFNLGRKAQEKLFYGA